MNRGTEDAELPFVPRLPEDGVGAEGAPFELPFAFTLDGYYDLLGVSQGTPTEKVKDASFGVVSLYQKRARRGDEAASQRLVTITTAQETLTKDDKRAEYDRRPDAAFFNVWSPFEEDDLSWAETLEAIRRLAVGPGDIDPLRDIALPAATKVRARLEGLLGDARRDETP